VLLLELQGIAGTRDSVDKTVLYPLRIHPENPLLNTNKDKILHFGSARAFHIFAAMGLNFVDWPTTQIIY
jgi:hypothetical protein